MAGGCRQLTPPPAGAKQEVSQLARRKSEDCYTLPDLQARGLAALCEEFFSQPGVEDEYQAWVESKKGKHRGVRATPHPPAAGAPLEGEPMKGDVAL